MIADLLFFEFVKLFEMAKPSNRESIDRERIGDAANVA